MYKAGSSDDCSRPELLLYWESAGCIVLPSTLNCDARHLVTTDAQAHEHVVAREAEEAEAEAEIDEDEEDNAASACERVD